MRLGQEPAVRVDREATAERDRATLDEGAPLALAAEPEFFELRQVSAIGRPGLGGAQSAEAGARAAFDALFGRKK